MKWLASIFLLAILGFGFALPLLNTDICKDLCDKRWRPDQTVTAAGVDKMKHAKDDYLLFNSDQTAILFEGGNTYTANWIYDDVVKSLTLNFKGIERLDDYILYTVDKKNLVLIDLANKKRVHYTY